MLKPGQKFIQIVSLAVSQYGFSIFALDLNGDVWQYFSNGVDVVGPGWKKIEMRRVDNGQ